ncbi:relaxase/mobilization nuclease [Streptomyces sp. NPDC056244]|uniref:relaxase/mobilization nuclease n=1 Tax=Streptomyces sp. NPDC056244 TaxID=3345762 RepID=UPI0035DCE401
MIPYVHSEGIDSAEALAEALGRPVSDQEELTGHTLVAYWPGLDHYTLDDEQETWTSAQWAEHLDDPNWENPFAASPQDGREAIFHAGVRLAPGDRTLTGPEWSEVAHRLARAAGIAVPGDEEGCRWIAVQARPGRLDLLANLIRLDGTWQRRNPQLHQRLAGEARRIEADLQLQAPAPDIPRAPGLTATGPEAVSLAGQIDQLLSHLTDERAGPLATVRGLVEYAARRLTGLPQPYGPETGLRLDEAARRLSGIQQDLDHIASTLRDLARSSPATPPAPAAQPAPAHRRPR